MHISKVKKFITEITVIAFVYLIIAFLGGYLSDYLGSPQYFDFAVPAIAGVVAIRYGWSGVSAVFLGAFAFHFAGPTQESAFFLSLSAGIVSVLFQYGFKRFYAEDTVLTRVSSVASFALVIAPTICALHTVSTQLILRQQGLISPNGLLATSLLWWLDELLVSYLFVPIILSAYAYKKQYIETKKRTEIAALLLGMLTVCWLAMHFSQILGFTVILMLVLLLFVLWASVRFDYLIAHSAIVVAAILVMMTAVFSNHLLNPEPYQQTMLLVKVGLVVMILGGLFVVAAFTERNRVELELSKLANHDPLTGLPNRSYFQDFFHYSLSQAQRQKQQLYLLFIDLDRFKKINDTQGHEIGDAVLQIIAHRLDNLLRGDDFVARLGGDEFAMLYSHPAISKAASNLARKILRIISEPFEIGNRSYTIGASIGISVYPNDSADANSLLRQADLAMYQAKSKQSGFEYFSEEMNVLAHEQLQIENGLRQAIKDKELTLVYQPKLDLHTHQIIGLEALVRWKTKDGEMIGPDKFIPVAEDAGLIVPIGRYVIQEACAQWVQWHKAGLNPPSIAVNISPRQFSDPLLIKDITESLYSTGMDPSKLSVEITESATMDDPEMTLTTLKSMSELKLHLYIDDFGTGYSNLGQLRHLPIHALKIDKVFIRDILTNLDDAEIVNAIIRLAHALKLRVVCEGVETKTQLTLLKGLGCDEVQGYLIAKPLPQDQIRDYFGREIEI